MLAWASQICLRAGSAFGLFTEKFDAQVIGEPFLHYTLWEMCELAVGLSIARMVLASANAAGLCVLRRAAERRFGRPTGIMFAFLSCTQFHLPFWIGRTLPNMFALLPGESSSLKSRVADN